MTLTADDLRAAIERIAAVPSVWPRRTRFVHPDDLRHLNEHDGGLFACYRCRRIWADAEAVRG